MTDLCRVFLFIYLIIVMCHLVFSGTHKYHRVESERRESRETTEKTSE